MGYGYYGASGLSWRDAKTDTEPVLQSLGGIPAGNGSQRAERLNSKQSHQRMKENTTRLRHSIDQQVSLCAYVYLCV